MKKKNQQQQSFFNFSATFPKAEFRNFQVEKQ